MLNYSDSYQKDSPIQLTKYIITEHTQSEKGDRRFGNSAYNETDYLIREPTEVVSSLVQTRCERPSLQRH